jgi:TP901 family phage tail tape measure protein
MAADAELVGIITADASGLEKAIKKSKGGLSDLAGSFGSVGKIAATAGVAIAAAVGAAAVATISMASEFEKTMKNVQAAAGKTNDEMAALAPQILKIGSNAVAGPQKVAAAFYDIVGGVADASTHMDILNAAIATSEAGQADLGAATQGLISVMNSYKLAAKDAAGVSDVFTRTVGTGVGTMDQFVAAMSPVTGLTAAAGISFKQFGAGMAFMTQKGFNAAQAATAYKAAITAVMKPNAQMAATLKKIGVASGTAAIKTFGLAGTLQRLEAAAGGNKDKLAAMLGSVEALQASMVLGQEDFNKFADTFEGGLEGATEAARKVQLDSFNAQWDLFKNKLEAAGIAIGSLLLPPLNALFNLINQGANAVATLAGLIGGELGKALAPIGQQFRDAFGELGGEFDRVKGAFQKFLTDIFGGPGISEAGKRLSKKLGEDLAPDLTFGERLAKAITDSGPKLAAAVGDLIKGLGNVIGSLAGDFIDGFNTLLGQVGAWMSSDGPSQLLNGLLAIGNAVSSWFATQAWPMIKTGVEGLWLRIQGFLTGDGLAKFVEGFGSMITQVGTWVQTTGWEKLKEGVTALFGSVKTWLESGGLTKFIEGFTSIIAQLATNLATNGPATAARLMGELFSSIGTWISNNGPAELISGVETSMNAVATWLGSDGKKIAEDAFNALVKGVGEILAGIAAPIVGAVRKALGALADLLDKLPGGIGTATAAGIRNAAGINTGGGAPGIGTIPSVGGSGFKARGGGVTAGQGYIVGEDGPEYFKPASSGSIVPNGKMGRGTASGANFKIQNVYIYGAQNPQHMLKQLERAAHNKNRSLSIGVS